MDIRTLIIVLGLTDTLQAIALYLQYLTNRKQKGVGFWTLGFSFVAIGFLLLLFRDKIPFLFVSIILTNTLLNLGAILIYIGIMRFQDRKENRIIIYSLLLLFFFSFLFFTYIKNDINARTIITSCFVATMSLLTAYGLFTNKNAKIKLSVTLLASVFLLHGLFYIFRTIINLTVSPVHSLFSQSMIQITFYLVQITEGILVTVGLIVMINQKEQADTEEEKDRFKLIFNTSPDAALISSIRDGVIVDVNDGFVALTGYSRQELIGSSTLGINIWENPADRQKVVEELQKKGHCENMEALYRRKDGRQVFGSLSAKIINIKGNPHIISITRDVTENKKKDQEIAHFASFPKLNPYPVVEIGVDGTVWFANRSALETLKKHGLTSDTKQFLPDSFQDFRELRNLCEKKPQTMELVLSPSTFLCVITAPPDLDTLRVYAVDITERKKAEEAVKQLNEELEIRVKNRTQELETSNKELESFAYSVAHDLRAPLRAINGFSQMLTDDFTSILDVEGIRILHVIQKSTKDMDQLIFDLLAMSKITRTDMKKQSIDMNELVSSVKNEFLTLETQDRIKFSIDSLPIGYGDPTLLRQVWVNLIENAVKFSKTKDNPLITIGCNLENNQTVYFIKDNGVGFKSIYKNKLFGAFQRLHSTTEFEGTGIGLAIVERVITRHRGKVWAEGEEGVGATFYFSLPMAKLEENHGN